MKIAVLLRSARSALRSEARDLFLIAPQRSNSERAAPSACAGRRFSAPQIVWNRSTRRAGARGGARVGRPRWLRILMITGGSSTPEQRVKGAAMIFKALPQFRQCWMSRSKTRLSSQAQLKTIPAAANWREHFKHLTQPR